MRRFAGESSIVEPSLRRPVERYFRKLREILADGLREAQTNGELAKRLDASELAKTLIAVVRGGFVVSTGLPRSERHQSSDSDGKIAAQIASADITDIKSAGTSKEIPASLGERTRRVVISFASQKRPAPPRGSGLSVTSLHNCTTANGYAAVPGTLITEDALYLRCSAAKQIARARLSGAVVAIARGGRRSESQDIQVRNRR